MIASSPLCGTGRRGLALRVVSVAVSVVAAAAVGVWLASPVRAHSFLASTNPEEGARLSRAPAAVALQFSERVAASSVDISVRTAGGDVVQQPVPRMESGGHVARLPLSDVARGVYVVSWQVTSAVDGHESAGEFAFAVGDVAGSDVPLSAVALDVDGSAVAATWVFFAGLAAAAGGVVGARVLDHDTARRRTWLRAGSLVALVGIGWHVKSATAGPPAGARQICR
ncbi:MAG: copper resistance CopC family protein [Egibacteraceae bacterium]